MNILNLSGYVNIWDPAVQQILIDELNSTEDRSDILETIISIHSERRSQMVGLYRRSKLDPASKFKWENPRDADGVPIFARQSPGITKENHKLHTPFDRTIITNKAGYLTGQFPQVMIAGDDEKDKSSQVTDALRRQSFDTGMIELCQKATGRGTSFVLLASPPGEKEVYITYPREWEGVVLYDNTTGDPVYGIRYWFDLETGTSNPTFNVELYDSANIYKYSGNSDSLVMYETVVHAFAGVPLIEFPNNTDRIGDVELTLSLQDSFDIIDSDIVSEISQIRLAYMWLRNLGVDIDDAWIQKLTQTGVFTLEEDGDAGFIEKNLNSDAVQKEKDDLEERIYKYSNSFDPDKIAESGNITAYQIQNRLMRLESSASETEGLFRQALRRMVYLLSEYYSFGISADDITFIFTRNVPRNSLQDLKDAVSSGFKLSQGSIARLLPFDFDFDKNTEELQMETEAGGVDIFRDTEEPDPSGVNVQADAGAVGEQSNIVSLNGAQVSSATEIVKSIGTGELTRESAMNLLEILFNLTREQTTRMVEGMEPGMASAGTPVADPDPDPNMDTETDPDPDIVA